MSGVHERCALAVRVGAAAAAVASPCYGGIIPSGLYTRAEASEWISPWIGIGDQEIDTGHAAGLAWLADADAAMTANAETSALAFANYGFLTNSAASVGTYVVPSSRAAYTQAITNSSFRDDQVVVLAPGVATGTPGTLTAEYFLDNFENFDLTSITGFAGDAVVVGGFSISVIIGSYTKSYTGTWTYDAVSGILTPPSLPPGAEVAMVPFQYGVPFTIAAAVEMKLTAYIEGSTTAVADIGFSLGPSFIWEGITDGLPDDATVSSPSVPDWRNPYGIPAPGATAAVLLASAGSMARRRRRTLVMG